MIRITQDARKRIIKAAQAAWTWAGKGEAADLYNLNYRDYRIYSDLLIEADDKPWLSWSENLNTVVGVSS